MAHYFLWTYPKNADIFASRFRVCEKYARGTNLWKWIIRIQSLKARKIVWFDELDDPEGDVVILTVDGIDFRIWEIKHPELNMDNRNCSHKHGKSCSVKYELGVALSNSKLVWINGPFRGSREDKRIFHEDGLREKMGDGKLAIADKAYNSADPRDRAKLAVPNDLDSKEVKNFKAARVAVTRRSMGGLRNSLFWLTGFGTGI